MIDDDKHRRGTIETTILKQTRHDYHNDGNAWYVAVVGCSNLVAVQIQ